MAKSRAVVIISDSVIRILFFGRFTYNRKAYPYAYYSAEHDRLDTSCAFSAVDLLNPAFMADHRAFQHGDGVAFRNGA